MQNENDAVMFNPVSVYAVSAQYCLISSFRIPILPDRNSLEWITNLKKSKISTKMEMVATFCAADNYYIDTGSRQDEGDCRQEQEGPGSFGKRKRISIIFFLFWAKRISCVFSCLCG